MRLSGLAFLLLGCASGCFAQAKQVPTIEDVTIDSDAIELEFDRPMQTWGGKTHQPNIKITPEVDCNWTWEDDTAFVCYTEENSGQIKPATHYKISVGEIFKSQEGVPLAPTTRNVKTDGPLVRAFVTEWSKGQPSIHLITTLPVTTDALREKLSVLVNAKPVPFELLEIKKEGDGDSQEPGSVYAVNYGLISSPNALLSFVLKPGLKSRLGPVPGEQKGEFLIAKLNAAFKLNLIECQNKQQFTRVQVKNIKSGGVKCDPDMPIAFGFSDLIDPASLAKFSESLPPGFTFKAKSPDQFRLDQLGYYYYYNEKTPAEKPSVSYELMGTVPASQYLLEYPAGFVSVAGVPIERSAELLFEIGDLPKTILVKPGVKTQFPGEHDITRLEVVNSSLKTTKINYLNIADAITQTSSVFSLEQQKNKWRVLNMPLPDKKIQDSGGLMLAGSEEVQGLAFSFAYVPFNVLHYQARNQVVVWATDWKSGKPIANARVEIIRIDKQRQAIVSAIGSTDANGVAKIEFDNRKILADDQMSLIRVTRGGQRVVSPALFSSGSSLDFKSTYEDWHYRIATKKKVFTYGVTELPLYRPGEKVNYRIWLRQKVNNHLRLVQADGPANLQLRDTNNNKTLQTWQAKLDANASVAGELSLSQLLPDGLYCITSEDKEQYRNGACFQVARFEAQPLWAKLTADHTSVLAGQSINLAFDSGYFSGGPAADLELKFDGLVQPKRFESIYPEFQGYTFINPFGGEDQDEEEYRGIDPLQGKATPRKTDSKGEAGFHLSLDTPLLLEESKTAIAFGTLEFSAEVRIPGKASAGSETISVNYAQYESYVGLKTKDWWLRQDQDPGLEAVVVSHDGKAIAGETVVVSIFRLLKDKKENPVGECSLVSGQPSPCGFRATDSGQYIFRARSKDSASTELTRYVGKAYQKEISEDDPKATLLLLSASDGKSNARVRLSQPYQKASALFTLEYDQIVQHWVQILEGTETEIEIPVKSEWAPGLSLRVIVRPADAISAAAAKKLKTLEAVMDLDIPRLQNDALTISASKKSYRPDEEIELLISNPTSTARFATLSVIDDSVYQQGNQVWNSQDPNNKNWLGTLKEWEMSSWYGFENWAYTNNIFFTGSTENNGINTQQTGRDRGGQPVQVLTRANIERSGTDNFYEVLNSVTSADGSGLSTIQTRYSNGIVGANGIKEIDKITVTGSKIRRQVQDSGGEQRYLSLGGCDTCDVVQITGAKINRIELPSVSPAAQLILDRAKNNPGKAMPRVRSQFVDAAYWNPDIVLAPGESKKIKFKLPDNLTQWRVLLWSADDSDGFAQSQITFDTSLPIELRTGLPAQLFVGDKASAQITARNQTEAQIEISLKTALSGAGLVLNKNNKGLVKPYVALEQNLDFSPTQPGSLDVLSVADSASDTDGLSSGTVVQSRFGSEKIPQSGWLDLNTLSLTIPTLPSSALDSKIDLQVSRGFDTWTAGWLNDLHEYPHRCWEQTLSRAVGAAYAQAYDKQSTWSDPQATVNDALQVATSFQDDNGYYRYFQNQNADWAGEPNLVLSAYTLKAFNYLQTLGYPVQKNLVDDLNEDLPLKLKQATKLDENGDPQIPWETAATIAGVIEAPENLDPASLQSLWDHWEKLSWFARAELLQALSRKPQFAEQTQQGIQRLREAGDKRGLRQVIGDARDFSYYMGSDLRDQCAVLGTLFTLDKSEAGRAARERLLHGVYDLYAGGTVSQDTQSSAQCLMTLHGVTKQNGAAKHDAQITVALDKNAQALPFAAEKQQVNWQSPLASSDTLLSLATNNTADGTMNYTAVISYQYDLQQAEARGVGLNVQREYDVLKNGKWTPLLKNNLREGDWVRVRLIVIAPKQRHFVAVSDFAPGGLVTRDITLSSVGGAGVKNIGGNGSYYFDSRQTGPSIVRIYAEYLPAGRHEIYYYAQAVHSGNYFAPPAIAELMYGRASRASTTADRVTVVGTKAESP